jgi:hypothetical protein
MRLWRFSVFQLRETPPVAFDEFSRQMILLVEQLPFCFGNALANAGFPNLTAVISIPAFFRFFKDEGKIRCDCGERSRVREKARELRMTAVAGRFSLQDFLSKQALSPEGAKPPRIEVAGMKRP